MFKKALELNHAVSCSGIFSANSSQSSNICSIVVEALKVHVNVDQKASQKTLLRNGLDILITENVRLKMSNQQP